MADNLCLLVTCTFSSPHPGPLGHVCRVPPAVTLVSNTTSAAAKGYTHNTVFKCPLLQDPCKYLSETDCWTTVEQEVEIESYPWERMTLNKRVLPG